VDVTFSFFNNGPTEKVQLGFPVEAWQHDIRDEDVYDFKSYINGEMTPKYTIKRDVIRKFLDENERISMDKYIKWFVRDVTFPANSLTVSRVTYKALYSYGSEPFVKAGYIYGTGRFWNGAIEKMNVVINHGDDILIEDIRLGDIKASEFKWEANGRYRYVFENVRPKSTFGDRFSITVQPFDIYGNYEGQFGLMFGNILERISGRKDRLDIEKYYEMFDCGEWQTLWAWDKFLIYKNPKDIRYYTKNQIRLFINFFSAIHGYDFKNPLYKEYFQKVNNFCDKNRTKYEVNPNFSEDGFNEIERKNVDYLLNLEKKIPTGQ
jgi:hypothetical protein